MISDCAARCFPDIFSETVSIRIKDLKINKDLELKGRMLCS